MIECLNVGELVLNCDQFGSRYLVLGIAPMIVLSSSLRILLTVELDTITFRSTLKTLLISKIPELF
jgi:hypothetical protein